MKKLFFIIFLYSFSLDAQIVVDKVVAQVEKEIITESDLFFATQMIAAQNKISPNTEGLREKILDGLISEKLILAQAEEDSILVSDEEVNDRLERQIKMLIQNYGSEEKVAEIYNMPVSKMKREYRDEIRKQLVIQKIKQTKEMGVSVSRREVEEFYNNFKDSLPDVPTEYELSHIYISPKPDTNSVLSSLKFAQSLIDSLKRGSDFSEFAKKYSSDLGSGSLGGDLGKVRRGVFVKEFEEAAFTLKINDISKPIRTIFGYHIIQVTERKGDQIHPRHILIKINQSEADNDSAITKLNDIRKKALNGELFPMLAKTFSEDPETKDIGGDMGRFVEDQIDEKLLEVVKNLKVNEISEPQKINFGSGYGYHIVLVRSVSFAHKMNLVDDYRRLEGFTLQQKIQKKNDEWVESLKKSIFWEIKN